MSKKGVYGIWLLIMFILFVLFQNTFFGALFLVFLCMGYASTYMAKVLCKSVEVSLECEATSIEVDDRILFDIKVKNKSYFPTNKIFVQLAVKNYFFRNEEELCLVNVPVTIKGEDAISTSINCEYVGNVKVSLKKAIISDFLGLVTYEVPVNQSFQVDVMPHELVVPMEVISKASDEEDTNSETIDAMEAYDIKEVREYRAGDSLHRIHWNLSARMDEYLIKEYDIETVSRFNILVDIAKEHIECINELIEALCSAINEVLELEQEFSVYWYDDKIEMVREMLITSKHDVKVLLDEIYSSGMAEDAGQVYFNMDLESLDLVNAMYITADGSNVRGEILGEHHNVVLMSV